MQWLTLLFLPLIVGACWLYTIQVTQKTFPTLRKKRIVLLIAHPDDEAMFFAPTVLALTVPELGNHIKILCLSNGDADGLGKTRARELVKSALMLGLRKDEDIFIVENPEFVDSMTATWSPQHISTLLTTAFAPLVAKTPSTSAPPANIDVLITFDRQGVSAHPNHISLYHGARQFLSSIMKRHAGWECPIALYTLTSTSVLRKYLSVLDAPLTLLQLFTLRKKQLEPPSPLMFASGFGEYREAQKAMIEGHRSQMKWFRWGWVGASRYMVINDLMLEKII